MFILMLFFFIMIAATVLAYWKHIAIIAGIVVMYTSAFAGIMFVIIIGYVEWLPLVR
jgi:hypothetical protein